MIWFASFYYVFLYLAYFVVSAYVIFIRVCWILMVYTSSATYLLTRLQNNFSRRNDHMQVHIIIMEGK